MKCHNCLTRQSKTSCFAIGAPFAAIVPDDTVKQSGASWRIRWKFWLLASARFPRHHCQRHAPCGPLCKNMTSATKPEVHNVLHCHQRRTEPRPQVTCIQKIMWSLDVLFKIWEHRDRHTDTLITIPLTSTGRQSNCRWIRGTGILISGNFLVSQ